MIGLTKSITVSKEKVSSRMEDYLVVIYELEEKKDML